MIDVYKLYNSSEARLIIIDISPYEQQKLFVSWMNILAQQYSQVVGDLSLLASSTIFSYILSFSYVRPSSATTEKINHQTIFI